MDANSGKDWSELDLGDLTNDINIGLTVAQIASFLSRDEDEVRAKMKELALIAHPRKRSASRVVR